MSFNIDATISFLKSKIGKVTYSMKGSRNFSDGTCDCSGAVYTGLVHGGLTPAGYIPSTETLHAWLISNGFTLIAENTEWPMQKGDVVIWGRKGYSYGANGHTGICIDGQNWLECTAWRDLGETIQNHDARWEMNEEPYFYVYRYTGETNNIPQPEPQQSVKKVNVTYGMRPIGMAFLPPVTNIDGGGDNSFAGLPTHSHDFLYIKVDHGAMKYRVKTNEDGWLPWVTKGDPNDLENGCAGIAGHAITGVQMVYITPAGETYQQAWYRTQDSMQLGWHGVVCDDGTSVQGYTDDYAGWGTFPVDRLQIVVGVANPY